MSDVIKNKTHYALIFSVENANPNGDPMEGNRPRQDDDGYGLITDVCLKRKLKTQMVAKGMPVCGYAYGGIKGQKGQVLKVVPDAHKNDLTSDIVKHFFDARVFGIIPETIGLKGSAVTGPVTLGIAKSIEPIEIVDLQITKSYSDTDGRSDTMGNKSMVSKAIYVSRGGICPVAASKVGFSQADQDTFFEILPEIFDADASAARPAGSMVVEHVVIWEEIRPPAKNSFRSRLLRDSLVVSPSGDVTAHPVDGVRITVDGVVTSEG